MSHGHCEQGDQPHCGFPEANYHLHAERLARAGLRVVVIEQTETPEQLRIRNEERRAAGKTKACSLHFNFETSFLIKPAGANLYLS